MRKLFVILVLTLAVAYGATINSVRLNIGTIRSVDTIPSVVTLPYTTTSVKMATLGDNHFVSVTEHVGNDNIPYVLLWNNLGNLRAVSLPSRLLAGGTNDLVEPVCEFVATNKLMIASRVAGGSSVRVTEYTLTNDVLSLVLDFTFGDSRTQSGASCILENGRTVFAFNYKSATQVGELIFRVGIGWRLADSESAMTNRWTVDVFEIATDFTDSFFPSHLSMVQGSDGLVYLFFAMDSMGQVGIARFDNVAGVITLIDSMFIESGSASAISGEFPRVSAIRDTNRIVLIHQAEVSTFYPECSAYTNNPASDTVIITSVETNLDLVLIAALPWPSLHINFPLLSCWPRADGIYFFSDKFHSCTNRWLTGTLDYTTGLRTNLDIGAGTLLSKSDDGYVFFQAGSGTKTLSKTQFQ